MRTVRDSLCGFVELIMRMSLTCGACALPLTSAADCLLMLGWMDDESSSDLCRHSRNRRTPSPLSSTLGPFRVRQSVGGSSVDQHGWSQIDAGPTLRALDLLSSRSCFEPKDTFKVSQSYVASKLKPP